MAVVIGEVILAAKHGARWRLRCRGDELSGGTSVLRVTDGSEWWEFECRSEGDNKYCISGPEWRRFAQPRVDALITLYSREEGDNFHIIRVRC